VVTVTRTALDLDNLSTTATGGAATITTGGGATNLNAGANAGGGALAASNIAGIDTLTGSGSGAIGDVLTATINGTDISYTATGSATADQMTGLAAAINADGTLSAQGYTATATATTVTLARDDAGTLTVGGSIDSGDIFEVTIAGTTVSVTISTSDGYSDDNVGAIAQIEQAINDAGISGLTVTNNGDGSLQIQQFGSVGITSATNASTAVEAIDAAIQTLNTQRSSLGAVSNRMDNTVNNLTNISVNLSVSKGAIEDADFAAESTNLAKNLILQQAAIAMLAQANASKQDVLSLLQN
jgi:flagellin